MSSRYKAIIFDFFDVIANDPFLEWLEKHDYKEVDFEEVNMMVDMGHISEREFYEKLGAISGQTPESIRATFGKTQLLDNALIEIIKKLHAHYKIGLLSNASGEYLRPILQEQDLAPLFDEIVISAEVRMAKPSAEIFHYILDKMNQKPQATIFIDDRLRNVETAASLGMQAIVYTGKEALLEKLQGLGVLGVVDFAFGVHDVD